MALDFVAIDFETANFARASACSVGLARVKDGMIEESAEWYIDPPGGAYFTNTFIHGISAEDVLGAPQWAESLERMAVFAGDLPLVAYSDFDRGVYNAANSVSGTVDRGFEWKNAHSLARRSLTAPEHQLENYKLPTVSKYLAIPAFNHHNAAADAVACARVVLRLAEIADCNELDRLWPELAAKKRHRVYKPKSALPEANLEADRSHPLYRQSICFTGKLDSFTKDEARLIAADFGATVEANVTKRTTLVVVGQFTLGHLRAGAKLSSKALKAATLAANGQPLEIVDEETFLSLINLEPADY